MSATLKDAPYEASLSEIPTPISAYLIAMRSFAPSPHIPTFQRQVPKILSLRDLLLNYYCSYSMNFFTILALFSGDVLAKSLICRVRVGSGVIIRKSLSIANA